MVSFQWERAQLGRPEGEGLCDSRELMNTVKRPASLPASTADEWGMTVGAPQECTGGGERVVD